MNRVAIVRRLLDSGLDFALYRFPGEQEPRLVLQKSGHAQKAGDCSSGFVFAPFAETERVPTLIIQPDIAVSGWELIELSTRDLGKNRPTLSNIQLEIKHGDIDQSEDYKKAFRTFKNQLDREEFQKLVLSYSQLTEWEFSGHEDELYDKAISRFPNSMVYLVYTQKGGRWFGCTPELLLEGSGVKWKTMALAGTMSSDWGKEWSQKNIREQKLVSDYIEGQLQTLNARIIRKGPYTSQAAHLVHLRTDFTFHTPIPKQPEDILTLLHPTPALCGLPKDEAWRFIRLHEKNQRMYYGGYLGPLNLYAETKIFVNIRCCNIRPSGKAILFAGGGLTRDSNFSMEREEIKNKLGTLKSIKRVNPQESC